MIYDLLQAESGFSEDNKHSDHEPVYGFRHIAWSPTGGRWFRITGAAGNALARADPGKEHCGTTSPGWLSAWNPSSGDPPKTYNIPGDYPVPSDGTVDMTVCFDAEGMASAMTDADFSCKSHTTISVRNCALCIFHHRKTFSKQSSRCASHVQAITNSTYGCCPVYRPQMRHTAQLLPQSQGTR
eukprot:SAG31_NODE_1463_length_8238_cov_3.389851_5_plen_184_part_00